MLSILVLSTKKQCSSFLKSACVFQKIYFKAEVLKSFKIYSDCHRKSCWSLKWRAILKIPILKESKLFLLALKWNLYEKAFSCVKSITNFCPKPCWNAERSSHSFLSNWWIAFFKHLHSLIMWQYNIYKLIDCVNIEKSQKQPSLYFNEFLYWIEQNKVFPVSIVKPI